MFGGSRVLSLLSGRYAICRFSPDQDIPTWSVSTISEFLSITRSRTELSVICAADALPAEVAYDADWYCLRIEGSFGIDEPGVLASVASPLAHAGISTFAIATHDTDYLLVTDIYGAVAALRAGGHQVTGDGNGCDSPREARF